MTQLAEEVQSLQKPNRKDLNYLLVYTFVMVTGFTMLMPLVAVHFVNNVGMTATIVGLALAVRQITQQGLTVIGGLLSDKFGIKPILCFGVLLRALGFAALAWSQSPLFLFLALIIAALGGALFEAPYQAAIAVLTKSHERQQYYLLSNFVGGIASTTGPLLGMLLLQFNFTTVCLGAAACFLINYLIATFLMPQLDAQVHHKESASEHPIRQVFNNKYFVLFIGFMTGYWFTAMQINISFPLWAEKITGNLESVSVMYALSAALTVVFQYPLVKWLEKLFNTQQILFLGVLVMSLSTALIAFVSRFFEFLICVGCFTLGVLLTRPTQQTLTAALADKSAIGTFMGFSSIGLAIGGGLGNFIGGYLFDVAVSLQLPELPWLIFGGVGLLSGISMLIVINYAESANALQQS
ncbi:MFS transporter [Aliikangiella maris]|uniref:MFS transporter n=2 Tax=Aliikangiella maris TaxID=3162458 RepID=A0ABV3MQ79_9GAMM